jgi:hypothetical protein
MSTCRESLLDTRNKALEILAIGVQCPCPNKLYGFTLTFPVAHIIEHEDVCQFGPIDCPLNYRIKCNWTGPLTEIKGHVLHKHKDVFRSPYVRMFILTKTIVQKFNKDKEYADILLSNDNLFFGAYEVIVDAFYYVIQYSGPEIGSSQFKYKFVFECGAEGINVFNVASSYSMDVKGVYSTGKCVRLFCDTIERFIDEEKNLQFHVDILKVKDAHKIILL